MSRKKQRQARKFAAAALALSLALSSSVYAAAAEKSAASTTPTTTTTNNSVNTTLKFSDVGAQHWALKHISKLAALGIVQGFERSEYRPENSVSQQDVIIMAIRLMGLETEALANKVETVLPVAVSDYAKPYITYAFDKGLLVPAEEAAASTSKTAWGARDATREWVAKLVVRSIGKESTAKEQAASPTPFADAKDLSSGAAGYVNAAVSLGLVQGFEDNTFQPKGKVTRAQMATFLSRADKQLTARSTKVATGYVMELTDRKISVLNGKGDTVDYTLSADTIVYSGKDDSRIPLNSIKLTNEVYLIQNQGGALYIELTNDQQKMETYEGTLNELYLSDMAVSLQQGSDKKLYYLAANVAVTDKDGRGLSLNSVVPGTILELKRNTLLKEPKISQIVVKQVPLSKTAEGTVLNVLKDQNQVVFLEKSGGQNETYGVAARAFLTLADGTPTDISKLRVGDTVRYEIKNNELVAVTITKQADVGQTVQGTLTNMSDDKRILTIKKASGSALGAYYIADNAIVTIDGLPNASLFDLESGDELSLDVLNDKVVKVTVSSRSVKNYTYATIIGYDTNTKILTLTTDNDGVAAFRITDTTTLKYFDTSIPVTSFQQTFIQSGSTIKKRVNLKVSKDRIISVEMTSTLDGTIAQINPSLNELTLRTVGGQNITFKAYSSLPVELQNKTNGTVSDLKVGDPVRLKLSGNQDYIESIVSKRLGVYKVIVTNAGSRDVTVKDEAGVTLSFKVDSNDKIVNPSKSTHTFDDIQVDEYVRASFTGAKIDQVVVTKAVRGKVTNVDTSLNTITVQDFQGGVQAIPLGQNFTIKQAGSTSVSLTSIKVNDRVEVYKDASDKYIVQVAQAAKRVVSSYDDVLNRLVLKPGSNNEKTTYNFFAKAYLHKGNQTVAANAFAQDEEITVFVLDDKVFEIEKP